jgi:hypothetical protein
MINYQITYVTNVECEMLMAVNMKHTIFWDVLQYSY